MRTESVLVAKILEQRPVSPQSVSKAVKLSVTEQSIKSLLSEVQTATKIINEIFVEASFHVQEFARVKKSSGASTEEEQNFATSFRQWFHSEIHSAITQMPGATQNVACYVLKDRLERFPIFDDQWVPPFVRNGTTLEKFLVSKSPTLLTQMDDVTTVLTRHKTNASESERDTVNQWQAALNELAHSIIPPKASLKI